jgi:phosphoglycerate kinase
MQYHCTKKVTALMEKAKSKGIKLVLSVDYMTTDKFDKNTKVGEVTDESGIPNGWPRLDVRLKSRKLYCETVTKVKTILWNRCVWLSISLFPFHLFNGQPPCTCVHECRQSTDTDQWLFCDRPAGVFKFLVFTCSSKDLLDMNIDAATWGATIIVGGGNTATVVANYNVKDKLSHVSTSGGASLELLEGKVCGSPQFYLTALGVWFSCKCVLMVPCRSSLVTSPPISLANLPLTQMLQQQQLPGAIGLDQQNG